MQKLLPRALAKQIVTVKAKSVVPMEYQEACAALALCTQIDALEALHERLRRKQPIRK